MTAETILDCALTRWSPEIGDPTPLGWATVAVYFLAALAALAAFRRSRGAPGAERAFWILAALLLAALGVNKQLDLQSFLTASARCLSQASGWYENRRPVQVAFVVALGIAGVLGFLLVLAAMWRARPAAKLALAGLALVFSFVTMRAVGFHHMDAFIRWAPGGVRMNWALEIGGCAIFTLGALAALRPRRR